MTESLQPREVPNPIAEIRRAIWTRGFGGAGATVERVQSEHPNDPEVAAYTCLLRLWSGDLDGAEKEAEHLLSTRPHAALYGVACEIADFQGHSQRWESLYSQGEALDGDDYLMLRAKHGHITLNGAYEEGVVISLRSLELYPQDPDAFSSYLMSLQLAGRSDEMQGLLDSPPEWFLGTAQYHNRVGMLLLHRRQLVPAVEQFRLAVAACPEGGSYWANLSMALRFQDCWDEAERAANFGLDLNSRNVVALQTLARCCSQRGDSMRAKEYEHRATEAIPAMRTQALMNKARELARTGRHAQAVAQYREVVRSGMAIQARTAQQLIVTTYLDGGLTNEASLALEDARTAGVEPSVLMGLEFRLRVAEGKPEEAERLLDRVLADSESRPDVLPEAIKFLATRPNSDRIDTIVDRFVAELPGTPSVAAAMVMHLDQCGRKTQARQVFQAARRRYPSDHTLSMVEAAFAAENGELATAFRKIGSLPPDLRKGITPTPLKIAKAVLKGVFGKKR